MMSIYKANKISARLLIDYASEKWGSDSDNKDPNSEILFVMCYDLYIKARSYAFINKITFWLAVISGLMVLFWPSIAIITKDFGYEKEFLKSAIVQTSVTGLAALTFAIYSHYKKRQTHTENLMRGIIYTDQNEIPVETIVKEIERIDIGFSFANAISKKDKEDSI